MDTVGNKIPRGEILIRGTNIIEGYLGKEKLTQVKLERNGWLHTGDIGELRVDNSIQIIDRIN